MEESPQCYIPSRPISSSSRNVTTTNDGIKKPFETTQKLLLNSSSTEKRHLEPPPGFMNTFGTQLSYNKGRGSNFISNNLSFNLEDDNNAQSSSLKKSLYKNEYSPSKTLVGSVRGSSTSGENRYNNNSRDIYNTSPRNKFSTTLPQSAAAASSSYSFQGLPESTTSNDYRSSISKSKQQPLQPNFGSSTSSKVPSYHTITLEKDKPDSDNTKNYHSSVEVNNYNNHPCEANLPCHNVSPNCKIEEDEMFAHHRNVQNKIPHSSSGLVLTEPELHHHEQRHQLQEEPSSFATLYPNSSYNQPTYRQSPQRYNGGSNQFYNTINHHPNNFPTVGGGGKASNKPYGSIKTASVYPNNLYNNITSVVIPGSSTAASEQDGVGRKSALLSSPSSMYESPQWEKDGETSDGPTGGVALRKPPGLEKQISVVTSCAQQRGSPLSNGSRNLNHASRRQAIYLPPNSRQLYEEIAIVGSAGSSSGRSSVSRQQSPLEPNFLQSSGSKHTSRGNSSEVDILESPLRYSPAPLGPASSQYHQQYQTKSITDHYSSKPPLPPESNFASNQPKDSLGTNGGGSSNGPRPPPRTRPKSWTSSLFNRALRNNHRSVTFQRVEEETGGQQHHQTANDGKRNNIKDHLIIADECVATGTENNDNNAVTNTTLPSNVGGAPLKDGLMQAKQQMLFYSLPRSKQQINKNASLNHNTSSSCDNPNSASSNFRSKTRSRTPSPFRTIMKNLVKGVVHEHPRIGSDGESEEGSRTSEDVVSPANRGAVASGTQMGASVNGANRQQTNGNGGMGAGPYVGVKMRQKNNISANGGRDTMGARKLSSQEEINKRLSLPADLKLPDNFIQQQAVSPTLEGPLSRATRRQSLSEIGFGRMDTYTKLDKLGEGTYATVFKGKSRLTDNLVALKEIRLEHEEGAPCTAIREVSLLKDLKHNNIVTLHDIVHTDRALTLVFEYLEKDLKQYMDDCGGILSMNNVKIFLFQLIRGLGYCHSRRILHRDLKPQNLLINEMGELKLADFGLARAKSVPTKTYSNEVVTLWYRPPDVLLGSTEYSTPIDMWGVGCIFYEMASGRPLFPGSTVEDELHLIFKVLGTPNEEKWHGISMSEELSAYNFPFYPPEPLVKRAPRLDQDGLDLVEKFLLFEAKKRISARNAMRHPYFGPTLGPAAIENLLDVQSIFTLPGVHLSKDPGYRSSAFNHASSGKSRRQSMLL